MADVYLSPSPAHFNTGYGNYGTEERRMNLIADVVEYELTRHGVTTVRNNPDMTLTEVVADANAQNPKIYVAIQSQAADTTQRGSQVYYYKPGGNGQRLASDIFNFLGDVTPTEDIGLSDGSAVYGGLGFYELRLDADFIIDYTYEIGVAIARGILEYLGIPYNEDTPENVQRMRAGYNGVIF